MTSMLHSFRRVFRGAHSMKSAGVGRWLPLLVLPLFGACGQTGDLYPPANEPAALSAPVEMEANA